MPRHNLDSVAPLPPQDPELSPAAEAHDPEPKDGAAVHTELHHLESSTSGSEARENLPETYSVWPQVKGVDPLTRSAPLYARAPGERGTRGCDVAHQTAPSKMFDDFPEKQQKSIGLLISGEAYTHIARRLGIDRSTLWRWRNRNSDLRGAGSLACRLRQTRLAAPRLAH